MNTRVLLVHLFAVLGLIRMMLAIGAIWRDQVNLAFIWLGSAMLSGGLEGSLTRQINVATIFTLAAMTFVPARFLLPLLFVFLNCLNAPRVFIGTAVGLIHLGIRNAAAPVALLLSDFPFLTLSTYLRP